MEESTVVFIFKEFFNPSTLPFSKTNLPFEFKNILKETFLAAGGTYLLDVDLSTTERWRISYWKSSKGYQAWLNDPKLSSYFELRNNYNTQNHIITQLEGPFSGKEILHV